MAVKVAEAQAEGMEFPKAINSIGDSLRASFVVDTSEDLLECVP